MNVLISEKEPIRPTSNYDLYAQMIINPRISNGFFCGKKQYINTEKTE